MSEPFRIGSAQAAPGQRSYGVVKVAERADGTPLNIHVIVVRGVEPGPVVCLNGGIHGDEYSGTEAATRLARSVDPGALKGTLVVTPIVNHPSFDDMARANHFDGLNLNRIFPGSPAGRLSERIAHTFLHEVIMKCTVMLDLHAAGRSRITPLVVAQKGYEALVWNLALSTGFDLVWLGGPWKGTGRIAALEAGIPAITIEAGGGLACDENHVAVHLNAVQNVLRHLGVLPGQPRVAPRYRVIEGGMSYARCGGFFHALAQPGDDVKAGQVLARITNPYGDTVEEVCAPTEAVVCMMRVVPSVAPGDEICILGKVVETRTKSNEHS
jgi:hypothetical protein